MTTPFGIGLVGAGTISDQYLSNLTRFPDLAVRFVADLNLDAAAAKATAYGIGGSGSVDALLDRADIDVVVNLTIPAVHAEVSARALEAGKHVWSEKPIALSRADAAALLALADARGLRIGVAPDTVLGSGFQAAKRALLRGDIGAPLTALALFQTSGPEAWHPNPEFLFAEGAGPLFDMGPYYLTALVHLLGPVRRVSAVASTARATRVIGSGPRAGTEFPVHVPTHVGASLEFERGAVAQAAFSFQAAYPRVGVLEVSGESGALLLPDPNSFDGAVELWRPGRAEPERTGLPAAVGRGLGVLDLVRSVTAGVTEQASGRVAEHVLDVMASIAEATQEGRHVEVRSSCEVAVPLAVDWDPLVSSLGEE